MDSKSELWSIRLFVTRSVVAGGGAGAGGAGVGAGTR